jgi:hypothetical protein
MFSANAFIKLGCFVIYFANAFCKLGHLIGFIYQHDEQASLL